MRAIIQKMYYFKEEEMIKSEEIKQYSKEEKANETTMKHKNNKQKGNIQAQ